MNISIKILEKRIQQLNNELARLEQIEAESLGDLEYECFATENINWQIREIEKAIKILLMNK